jgi:hypothetical protein
MKNIFKVKENDVYVVRVVRNPFFWCALLLFFLPWLSHEVGHYFQTDGYKYVVGYSVPFLDYFVSTFNFLSFLFPTSETLNYYDVHSKYSYMQFFVGILGVTEIISISLSLLDFPKNKSVLNYVIFTAFIITFIPSLYIAMLLAI